MHQLAFHEVDTYSSLKKQYLMMRLVISFYEMSLQALENSVDIETIVKLDEREQIGRFKYIPEDRIDEEYEKIERSLASSLAEAEKGEED